jgi:hypothetical protein
MKSLLEEKLREFYALLPKESRSRPPGHKKTVSLDVNKVDTVNEVALYKEFSARGRQTLRKSS